MILQNFRTYLQSRAGVTDEELHRISEMPKSRTFEKGQSLLHKGEVCRHAFFVEKGLLRAYTIDELGKEHIIQFASENWFMSDRSSAYFNEPSDFYIEAIEETTVVLLDKEFIDLAATESTSFRQYNERALQNHIRQLQKRINLLLGASAEKRYLDFISLYPDLTLRVPQWMIASYLGITPESLSRVRKELAKRNFKPH
jgi:CRP/FNR family transcriptional regulator, anaerobic regulatory protein